MPVRCMKVECIVPKDRREQWKAVSVSCQRMLNRLWQIWFVHHATNGSAEKLRKHFEAFNQWKEIGGEKPDFPCKVIEEPLNVSADSRSFYRILSAEFPNVHVRTRGLLTNAWQSLLGQRKAANGSLPGWISILFANESVPSFTRPQPIPFDKDNSKLLIVDDCPCLQVRLQRHDDGKSVVDLIPLILNKRKARNARVVVDRVMSGEYQWKGSSLSLDVRSGKWFVSLAYEMPKRAHLAMDPEKVLFIRPGRQSPWRVKIGATDSWRFGGNGMHVTNARRAIINERNSRKEHYRWAGSTQKGQGRRRAESVWTKLSSRYRDFTKRYNHEVSRQLIRLAVSRGCGRIVYLTPNDRVRESRFLSVAGNDHRSAMSWDYFQFGSMLAAKCEVEGIEFGKKPKQAKNVKKSKPKNDKPSTRRVRGVRKDSPAIGR